MISKQIVLYFLILSSLTLSGCWNRRDPEELAIVIAAGFEYDEERQMYEIIAQIANPQPMGDSGGGNGASEFLTTSAYGYSPFQASKGISLKTTRIPDYSHVQIVIISENLASKGISSVMDYINRHEGIRLNTTPFISKQGDIHNILKTEFAMESTGARGIERMTFTQKLENKVIPLTRFNEQLHILSAPGKDMFIPKIEYIPPPDKAENSVKGLAEEDSGSAIKLTGAATFRGEKLIGWVNEDVVLGWAFLDNRAFSTPLLIQCAEHNEHPISIELTSHSVKKKPVIDGNNIKIQVDIKAKGNIQNTTCPVGFEQEDEKTRSLNRRAAQVIRNHIEAAVYSSQELQSDFLGLGYLIYRKNPKAWTKLEEQWREKLKELVVEINVEFEIQTTGLINKPVDVWEGDDM